MRVSMTVIAAALALLVGCSTGHKRDTERLQCKADKAVKAPSGDVAAKAPSERVAEDVRVVEEHWPDGTLRLRKHVVAGSDGVDVDHGAFVRWYDNGLKEYEGFFVYGKVHGIETAWHRNGQKRTEQHYDHGLRHGPRFGWDEAGRLRQEEHYVRNKPDGTWTVWSANGKLKWRGEFGKGTPKQHKP